jgi:2-polyprenyl-3-methyl-5-hydroxy-6-metoxy-1,4-benzoquinol methylase
MAYLSDRHRDYRQCPACGLVFVPAHQHLDAAAEKAIYDRHENSLDDAGYRRFLSRMAAPLLARLERPSLGLDFGCGPAPLLARMLEAAGHEVARYDLYYRPDEAVLEARYDFITATETIEHLAAPGSTFARWVSMLVPGGWLGIMTKRVIDREAFAHWHYKNDLTHIAFFSDATFSFLARRHALLLDIVDKDVVLFRKPPKPHESQA